MSKISNFIQYHNSFTIAVMVIFMGASVSFAANPELRQGVLAEKETVRSIDNTYVVNTDFNVYDWGVKVNSVTEDTEQYYVDYTYYTIEVKDYIWQPIPVVDSVKISKKELGARDLGLYVADQLGQVTDRQTSYLKEVQKKEKKNGIAQKVVAVEYSGLVGQFLSADEKTFDGYQPVRLPQPVEPNQSSGSNIATVTSGTSSAGTVPESLLTRDEVRALIQDAVKQLLAGGNMSTTDTATLALPNIPTSSVSIIISGLNPQTINVGSSWGDLGATVSSTDQHIVNFGITAFVDGVVMSVPAIDTTVPGTHSIVYKVINGATNTVLAEATRMVNVVGVTQDIVTTTTPSTTVPIAIQIQGNNPATLKVGDVYGDMGAVITAPESAVNYGIKASLDGGELVDISQIVVDTSVAGVHSIVYTVVDASNATTTTERILNVVSVVPATPAVDTSALTSAITSAQSTHDSAVEGTAVGEYAVDSKAILQTAITTATSVKDNTSSLQADIDTAVTTLNTAVTVFEGGKVL